SRRRHTRFSRDWSSDVCSSDLWVYSKQTSGPKKDFGLPFSPPLTGDVMASYTFGNMLLFKSPTIGAQYRVTAAQDEIVPPEKTRSEERRVGKECRSRWSP